MDFRTHGHTGMNPIQPFLDRNGFVMLDGGLSTELERSGANLDHELWSSLVLLETPGLLSEAYSAYLEAGADIIATATYQASLEGFMRTGLGRADSLAMMQKAVQLALEARDSYWDTRENGAGLKPLVAASLGPYGACLHDGSEYHGNYAMDQGALVDFHRPRVEALADCGADLFAFETIPSLLEGLAIVELLNEFPDVTAWLSFSCRNGAEVAHGEPFVECARLADNNEQLIAVGINCTPPGNIPALLESAGAIRTPLAVYPNSGEIWDAVRQQWCGEASDSMDVVTWHTLGARLIGGCCRTGADDIRRMKSELTAALGTEL